MRLLPGIGRLGVVTLGLGGDRLAHGIGVEHLVHQQAAGGQVRPDHRLADAAEMGAQHALQLAHGALGIQPLVDRAAQRDRRGKPHDRAATIEQHRQQATEAAHQRPVFREQHGEPAALLVRGTADENRHRHQVHVQLIARAMGLQHLGQRIGVGLGPALLGDQRVAAAAPRQRHVGAPAPGRVAGNGHQRRRQPGLAAGLVQDQRVGQTVVFQHVDHRAAVVVLAGVFRLDLQRQPRLHQPAQQARPPGAAADRGAGAGHDGGRGDTARVGIGGRGSRRLAGIGRGAGGGHAVGRRGRGVRRLGRLFAGERQGILVRHRLHYGLAGAEAPSLTCAAASASASWRASCSACMACAARSTACASSRVRLTYQ
ncbi:hypothetical protein D3C87_350300 [compost metagenome]